MPAQGKKVCVIGAGASGLVTIKEIKSCGFDVDCFEQAQHIGGVFNDQAGKGQNCVYENTILTISNQFMSFSDFVPPERRFWHYREYIQYLQAYASRFGLEEHIRFRTVVEKVERQANERWLVTVFFLDTKERKTEVYDAVGYCTGTHQTPRFPEIPGLKEFTGSVVHSSEYKNNKDYAGKRVVVIGIGESGADMVREVGEVSSQCILALRSYPHVHPRLLNNVFSHDALITRAKHTCNKVCEWDHAYLGGLHGCIAAPLLMMTTAAYGMLNCGRGCTALWAKLMGVSEEGHTSDDLEHEKSEYKCNVGKMMDNSTPWSEEAAKLLMTWEVMSHRKEAFTEFSVPEGEQDIPMGDFQRFDKFVCKNASFVPLILDKRITPNMSGIQKVSDNTVYFFNGDQVQADVILLCTGFKDRFDLLPDGLMVPGNDVRNLYRHIFHPEIGHSLAFIGWVRPAQGGIPMCSEMGARLFAEVLSCRRRLPKNMKELIAHDKAFESNIVCSSPDLRTVVPSIIGWCDLMSRDIGCEPPSPWRLLFTDPKLLWHLWVGGFLPACYRLNGTHAEREAARQVIINTPVAAKGQVGAEKLFIDVLYALDNFILAMPILPTTVKRNVLFSQRWGIKNVSWALFDKKYLFHEAIVSA